MKCSRSTELYLYFSTWPPQSTKKKQLYFSLEKAFIVSRESLSKCSLGLRELYYSLGARKRKMSPENHHTNLQSFTVIVQHACGKYR